VRLRRQNGVCSHARNADTDSVKRVPENIVSATRIVVFLKSEALVNQLTVSCIWVKEAFVPLSAPATKLPFQMFRLLYLTMLSLKSCKDLVISRVRRGCKHRSEACPVVYTPALHAFKFTGANFGSLFPC